MYSFLKTPVLNQMLLSHSPSEEEEGSTPYDSKDLTVSVAPRHEVSTSMVSDQQTGRSDQIVKFPLVITNEGNIRDTFRLQACDPGIKLDAEAQCGNHHSRTLMVTLSHN